MFIRLAIITRNIGIRIMVRSFPHIYIFMLDKKKERKKMNYSKLRRVSSTRIKSCWLPSLSLLQAAQQLNKREINVVHI